MTDFDFVDEIPDRAGSKFNAQEGEFAAALRNNPGKWAVYYRDFGEDEKHAKYARAQQIRKGALKAYASGGFEAAVRSGVLYARYVGGAE
ncbi:hypothetical protein [Rhodococcus jostii]|uniref:hypothetical protein n=1 Tax=Rhodococcus jostii TaxID=132919 RepID=UPI003628D6E1